MKRLKGLKTGVYLLILGTFIWSSLSWLKSFFTELQLIISSAVFLVLWGIIFHKNVLDDMICQMK